jgi:hypothetical protein
MARLEGGAVRFDPGALRRHAEAFARPRFKAAIERYLDAHLAARSARC